MELPIHLSAGAEPPRYASSEASGMDLVARLPEPITLPSLGRALIPTGLRVACPGGHELQVRPRSGLALKKGLTVLNTPGTIDADYRGEIGVILINLGAEPVTIEAGERIAQLVLVPVTRARPVIVPTIEALGGTSRGAGGFGSTGR